MTTTSKRSGAVTKNMLAASTWRYSVVTEGYSPATWLKVRVHKSPAWVNTLFLCTRVSVTSLTCLSSTECVANHALGAEGGVHALLGRYFMRRAFSQRSTGAGIWAFSAFADHDHVDVSRRLPLQRSCNPGIQLHRSKVDVVVQLKAQPKEQTALEHAARN